MCLGVIGDPWLLMNGCVLGRRLVYWVGVWDHG